MNLKYDDTSAVEGKFFRPTDALDFPTNLYSFEVSSMSEVSKRIEKAEENAEYEEHDDFWKELDN